MITELCSLADKYGSDKGPKGHNYTPIYHELMCSSKETTRIVVEIGVLNGASIRMWLDYFPGATVFAIDIDHKALSRLVSSRFPGSERVVPILGSQEDPNTWRNIPNNVDFIIDDGSHIPEHQMKTLENNFCILTSHGMWIIEDTHCNFHELFNGTYTGDDRIYPWLRQRIIAQQMVPDGMGTGDFYKAKDVAKPDTLTGMIYGIRSYKSLIMMEKA